MLYLETPHSVLKDSIISKYRLLYLKCLAFCFERSSAFSSQSLSFSLFFCHWFPHLLGLKALKKSHSEMSTWHLSLVSRWPVLHPVEWPSDRDMSAQCPFCYVVYDIKILASAWTGSRNRKQYWFVAQRSEAMYSMCVVWNLTPREYVVVLGLEPYVALQ